MVPLGRFVSGVRAPVGTSRLWICRTPSWTVTATARCGAWLAQSGRETVAARKRRSHSGVSPLGTAGSVRVWVVGEAVSDTASA